MAADKNVFGQTLTYTYDAADRLTLVKDSLNGVLTSVYDAANRLTSHQFGGTSQTPLRIDFAYSNRNELTTITRYSDLAGTQVVGTSVYNFDDAGRLTNLIHKNGSGSSLANFTYTYDAANRVLTEKLNGTPKATYSYDTTDQLTSDVANNYSYDANGNRTMTGYQTGTGNRMTNDGVWTYTYDTEGTLIKKSKGASAQTVTYAYDHANRLVGMSDRATDGGALQSQGTYVYDALGNRVEKQVDADGSGPGTLVKTRFAYDDAGNAWADLDGSSSLTNRRIFLDGVDSVAARITSAGALSFYLPDRLGSIRNQTDASGVLVNTITYDGFGKVTSETSPSTGDRFKFTGRELDSESGLQYHHARYYDPATGRWTTADPTGFPAGDPNLYRYVRNGSPNASDPSGLSFRDHLETFLAGFIEVPCEIIDFVHAAGGLAYMELTGNIYIPAYLSQLARAGDMICKNAPMNGQYMSDAMGEFMLGMYKDMGRSLLRPPFWDALQKYWDTGDPSDLEFALGGAAFFSAMMSRGGPRPAQGQARPPAAPNGPPSLPKGGQPPARPVTEPPMRPAEPRPAAPKGPKTCFPAGTPVHTSVGMKAIEQIAVGDRVWAFDHQRLQWAEREVVEVYQLPHPGTMATVQVKGETMRATGGHPFWVVRGEGLAERPRPVRIAAYEAGGRQEGRWVLARDLQAGDEVLLRHGVVVALESVRLDEVEERVYNFHVAELQNYAVGECGILVHNTSHPPAQSDVPTKPDINLGDTPPHGTPRPPRPPGPQGPRGPFPEPPGGPPKPFPNHVWDPETGAWVPPPGGEGPIIIYVD